ncbi:ATP-binding cassette domain-containing protein [Nonomuraea sp. NPDC046570]|uniref:ATP-binding cassette domain-containing protein n=1 Tax=Nonomuraea sp. NPDC046570 TaxID=3155255 RepID=UPI0033F3BC3D
MIVASGLAVEGVFRGVGVEAGAGTLTVVAGAARSGRTSVLLTLAGRMKATAGSLSVGGHTSPRAIRKVAALGLVDGVTDFDKALTVGEHLRERRGLWRRPRRREVVHAEVLAGAGLDVAEREQVRVLGREGQVRLGVALALLDAPSVIVVDNVDAGLPGERQEAVWGLLRELSARGLTVVASCVRPPDRFDQLIDLTAEETP